MTTDGSCVRCGGPPGYVEQYDAWICRPCDVWLEASCEDPACTYCTARPATPGAAV